MTTQQIKQNETWKNYAFAAIVLIAVVSWATPLSAVGQGATSMVIGSILIGLNLFRRQNGVEMSKGSFFVGAFLLSAGWLEASPLYFQLGPEAQVVPTILPLIGLMVLANAIFKKLQANG